MEGVIVADRLLDGFRDVRWDRIITVRPRRFQRSYKEFKGWKVAAPNDTINRGAWWSIYRDATLDGLERQVNVSNQTLKQDEAAFQEARAEVREQQSSFFPSLTVTPQIERQKSGGGAVASRGGVAITSYSLEGTATWEPDVWGKIRRSVESSVANAQVTCRTTRCSQTIRAGTACY